MTRVPAVRLVSLRALPRLLAITSIVAASPWLLAAPHAQSAQAPPPISNAAQDVDWSDEVPAHLYVVDGSATLERDGHVESAEESTPLLAGDRLRTERGRVEVMFADGSVLDVDEYSSIEFLSESLLRLSEGRLRLAIARATNELTYRVDAAGATAWIRVPGEYRLAVANARAEFPQITLAVMRGSAELQTESGRALVRPGTASTTTARTAPSAPYAMNASASDAFDRWSDDQRAARTGTSTRYLPTDLRYYGGDFDRYGTWEHDSSYGYVWYPQVAVDWRPYYDGHWSFVGHYGWTWVGGPRWGWATHHYGRWGYGHNRWYWIPQPYWAPAWVSWGYAPGYYGWSPLGYNNHAVFGISVSVGFGVGVGAWYGWTAAPSVAFAGGYGSRYYGSRGHVVSPHSINGFSEYRGGPGRPLSVSADARPLLAPTAARRNVAVPRSGAIASPGLVRPDAVRDASAYQRGATRAPASGAPTRDPVSQDRPSGTASSRFAPRTSPATSVLAPSTTSSDAGRRGDTQSSSATPSRQAVPRGESPRVTPVEPDTSRVSTAPSRQIVPRSRVNDAPSASWSSSPSVNAPSDARPSRTWSAPAIDTRSTNQGSDRPAQSESRRAAPASRAWSSPRSDPQPESRETPTTSRWGAAQPRTAPERSTPTERSGPPARSAPAERVGSERGGSSGGGSRTAPSRVERPSSSGGGSGSPSRGQATSRRGGE